MKNIIFLSFLNIWSIDKNKGASSFYRTIISYINDGWNVILINPRYNVGITPKIEGLTNITFKPIFYPLTKIKKISFFGRFLHSFYGNYIFYKIAKKLLDKLNRRVLIYAYEVDGVKAGKKIAEEFKLPFITRFQGTVLTEVDNNWLNRLRYYPHFQAIETKADLTIMTNDGTRGDKVLKRLNNKSLQVKFWRNGVDINPDELPDEMQIAKLRNRLGLTSDNKVLMTISRLAPWKKVNRAIEALSVVVKDNPNVKLVIVGDGSEKAKLIDLTVKMGLISNVIFVGAVQQSEIKDYLDLADIFLSLYDLSNVGNPLLEAMSRGKAIITLNVGDTSEIIRNNHNGVILDLNQIDEIPKYILKILNDENYQKMLGENAKKYARENFWTWNERMKAELSVVNELYRSWDFK